MIISNKRLNEVNVSDEQGTADDLAQSLVKSQKKLVNSAINSIVGNQINDLRKESDDSFAAIADRLDDIKSQVEASPSKIDNKIESLRSQIINSSEAINTKLVKTNELIDKIIEMESQPEPDKPKHEWVLEVKRGADGLIQSVDAKQKV